MSVSGYVPTEYNVHIATAEGAYSEHPHSRVFAKVAISTFNKVRTESEIKVPCIVRRVYHLRFEVRRQELAKYLPKEIDPKKISILFYHGTEENTTAEQLDVTIRHKAFSIITPTELEGECRFKIENEFSTSKEGHFIYISLKIHDVVINHLAYNIAAFTNTSQITADYNIVLAAQGQSLLTNCFWYSHASFITKTEATKIRKQHKPLPPPPLPLLNLKTAVGDARAAQDFEYQLFSEMPFLPLFPTLPDFLE